MLTAAHARHLQDCLDEGGVAVFPSDTVYGLACDPDNARAVRRLYALKGRPACKPTAVMFFTLAQATRELTDLTAPEVAALHALLPGPVTLLLPNRGRRFPLANSSPTGPLGVRVPHLVGPLRALVGVRCAVLASSANLAGAGDPRSLEHVPVEVRRGADLVLDGGELPGRASTVVDLGRYTASRQWRVVRPGALGEAELRRALGQPPGGDLLADP